VAIDAKTLSGETGDALRPFCDAGSSQMRSSARMEGDAGARRGGGGYSAYAVAAS
jgi:hypothetical protein